ncbi:MAG: acylneuraminate cytidylyltransferase family protein [Anaerolineales bacterium]|nr:acylneuraminate cytidylyltransferase family protein [Anaerolineales bacterium]
MTPQVLALIPARGGSKSIPRKNIKPMAGIPMIAFSIMAAIEAKTVDRVVVSTDDQEIAAIAGHWGAEVPFMRPAEYAGDHSTDLEVFQHALAWFSEHENYVPEICVHLRPTYPVREQGDIDAVVTALLDNPTFDSVRSVAMAPETPFKMWFLGDDHRLSPVVECDIPEAYNQPRQILPPVYLQNACIDATRTQVITTKNSMTGSKIMGFVMDHNYDIDTEQQFEQVEQQLIRRQLHRAAAIQQRLRANG